MVQPCLERCTESANPVPITCDTCPSSKNVSLAEPKWYKNAVLLTRVFERVGLLRLFTVIGMTLPVSAAAWAWQREQCEPNIKSNTIPRHLSTRAIRAVVYAFAKTHKRPARVPLPRCTRQQAHPSVRRESAHLCRTCSYVGAVKLASTSLPTHVVPRDHLCSSRLQFQPSPSIAISC